MDRASKERLRTVAAKAKPLTLPMLRGINRAVRRLSSATHWAQLQVEWFTDNPEYFDHHIDQHHLWSTSRASFPWERGIFSSLAIRDGAQVLDLCCGDGFNAYHFYSLRSAHVTAIDFDQNAISHARRNFKAPNLEYMCGDIRSELPSGPFDNIVWDAAIEHFTEEEIASLLQNIRGILSPDGTLSGYTIVELPSGEKSLHQHEYEFHSKEDLARFLTPHFRNVQVFQTTYPQRTNLYFWASDGELPFDQEWNLTVRR